MRVIGELKDLSLLETKYSILTGWVVNLEGLSAYYDVLLSEELLEEVVTKIHINKQLVYINARKIIHEEDLKEVFTRVETLEKLGVDYYIYSDMAFYEIASELGITDKLIYQVNTYMTNSFDINIMLLENYSVVVSTEISIEELKEIVKNTSKPLYIHAFGYYPIFHSRRELISNYQKYRGLNVDTESSFDVVEELRDSHYPIEQNENGMVIYLDGAYAMDEELRILNALHNNLGYFVLGKFLSLEEYKRVLKYYSLSPEEELKNIYPNISKGLLYETSTLLKNGKGE